MSAGPIPTTGQPAPMPVRPASWGPPPPSRPLGADARAVVRAHLLVDLGAGRDPQEITGSAAALYAAPWGIAPDEPWLAAVAVEAVASWDGRAREARRRTHAHLGHLAACWRWRRGLRASPSLSCVIRSTLPLVRLSGPPHGHAVTDTPSIIGRANRGVPERAARRSPSIASGFPHTQGVVSGARDTQAQPPSRVRRAFWNAMCVAGGMVTLVR